MNKFSEVIEYNINVKNVIACQYINKEHLKQKITPFAVP